MRKEGSIGSGMSKTIRTFAAITALSLVLVGCSGSDDDAEGQKVRIGLSTGSLAIYMYYVADTLGFYSDEGLNVSITPTSGSADAAQQLASGNFDVAQGAASAMAVVMQKKDLHPFYSVITKEYRDLVVLQDSGINDLAGLKGERIGVSDLAGGEVAVLRYLLSQENLDQDVEIVATGEEPAAVASAMQQDRIAGYAGSKSGLIPIEELTDLKFKSIFPDTFGEGPVEALVASEKFADQEETLVGVARATARATEFCALSLDACVNVLREDHPEMVSDEKTARQILDVFIDLTTPHEVDGVPTYGADDREGWERYIEVFSFGDEPLIESPESIDLDALLIEGMQDQINDFDRAEVAKLAEENS